MDSVSKETPYHPSLARSDAPDGCVQMRQPKSSTSSSSGGGGSLRRSKLFRRSKNIEPTKTKSFHQDEEDEVYHSSVMGDLGCVSMSALETVNLAETLRTITAATSPTSENKIPESPRGGKRGFFRFIHMRKSVESKVYPSVTTAELTEQTKPSSTVPEQQEEVPGAATTPPPPVPQPDLQNQELLDIPSEILSKISDPEPADHWMLWVSIGGPFSEEAVQVKVETETTCAEVLAMLDRGVDQVLQEHVLGGALWRPLHPQEKVLEAVLHWGYWDEADRRDNQLVLSPCPFYLEIRAQGKARAKTFGELRFADTSGHQMTCDVELNQKTLFCSRDKWSPKFGEWRVEDLTWYVGHEPKRERFSKWTITFISKDMKLNRSREHSYFGHCLGVAHKKDLHWWYAGLLLAKFPGWL